MTRDDIIRMAREIKGASRASAVDGSLWLLSESHLERFAALVAAAEREACAKVVEEAAKPLDHRYMLHGRLAEAIRARGETK
jgi:hypothetical protein